MIENTTIQTQPEYKTNPMMAQQKQPQQLPVYDRLFK